jgi:hypothetical protein
MRYDSAARELKAIADQGFDEITSERVRTAMSPPLVTQRTVARLR